MDHSEWCAVVISRMMPMSPLGVKTVSEVAFPPPCLYYQQSAWMAAVPKLCQGCSYSSVIHWVTKPPTGPDTY